MPPAIASSHAPKPGPKAIAMRIPSRAGWVQARRCATEELRVDMTFCAVMDALF